MRVHAVNKVVPIGVRGVRVGAGGLLLQELGETRKGFIVKDALGHELKHDSPRPLTSPLVNIPLSYSEVCLSDGFGGLLEMLDEILEAVDRVLKLP